MILKCVGAFLLILGGIFFGRSIEKKYSDEVEFWHEVIDFFTDCQSQIGHNGATIDEICARLKNGKGKFSVEISDAVQYEKITEGGATLLRDFSKSLKTVDLQTQSNVYSVYLEEARSFENKAKEKHAKNGKTYQKLLPILCLGIAVLLW